MEKTLKSVFAKKRRVLLDLRGRPKLAGLPLQVTEVGVRIYERGHGQCHDLLFSQIQAVYDPSSGECMWRAAAA